MTGFSIACELPLSPQDMWRIRASAGFRRHVVEYGLLKRLDSTCARADKDGYQKRIQRYIPTKVDCPQFLRNIIGDSIFDVTDEQRWKDGDATLTQQFSIRPTHLAGLSNTTGTLTLKNVEVRSDTQRRPRSPSDVDGIGSDSSTNLWDSGAIGSDNGNQSLDFGGSGSDGGLGMSDDSADTESYGALNLSVNSLFNLNAIPARERCVHVIDGSTKVNLPGAGWLIERSIVSNLKTFYEMYPSCVAAFRQKLIDQFAGNDSSIETSVVIDRFLKHEGETESLSGDSLDLDDDDDGDNVNGINPDVLAGMIGTSFGDINDGMPGINLAVSGNVRRAFNGQNNSVSMKDELESYFVSA